LGGCLESSVRTASQTDLDAIASLYAHYVATSVATFELDAPDRAEWARRFEAITDAGLRFLVTERVGALVGYGYCAPWKTRPAYRSTVEDSVYVAPWAVGQGCGTELMTALLEARRGAGLREVIAVIADTGDHGLGRTAPSVRLRRCRAADPRRIQARPVDRHGVVAVHAGLTDWAAYSAVFAGPTPSWEDGTRVAMDHSW
jgi:L-amino acid N-acyltransferase YncA